MANPKEIDDKLYLRDILKFAYLLFIGILLNYSAYQIPDSQILVTPLFPITSMDLQTKPCAIQNSPPVQMTTKSLNPDKQLNALPDYQPFPFDPNKISRTELTQLGFSSFVCRNWIAYRSAGGRFETEDDLFKIYGIDTTLMRQLVPYVRLPKSKARSSFRPANVTLDINMASIEDWQKLKGIGPVLSRRIVKFREALGGFHSTDQVGQTFGLPDSTFKVIQSHLKLSTPYLKMDVNTLSEDALRSHPYVSWNQARILVNYRKERGRFRSMHDLRRSEVFDKKELQLLEPYLNLDVQEEAFKDTILTSIRVESKIDTLR